MSSKRLQQALSAIDAAHAEDPNLTTPSPSPPPSHNPSETAIKPVPYELHYARKMTDYLSLRLPDASEPLQLAVRAQHFRRWEVPRASYPMTRVGYHAWRTHLKRRQASLAGAICRDSGYDGREVELIERMIRKEGLGKDKDVVGSRRAGEEGEAEEEMTQVLEDVACLVFLDDQFEEFEKEIDEGKMVRILRKTWGKMSEKGQGMALEMHMSERASGLIEKALTG